MIEVKAVGGVIDGWIGNITDECMTVRFFVHWDGDELTDDTLISGYYWNGYEYDDEGRPIFHPGAEA